VESILLSNNEVTVKVAGTVSHQPITAEFVLAMEVEALVKVD
jgi:hypothetical protein